MNAIVEKFIRAWVCGAVVLVHASVGCQSHRDAHIHVQVDDERSIASSVNDAAANSSANTVSDSSHVHAHDHGVSHTHAHDESVAHVHGHNEQHSLMHPSHDATASCSCDAAINHHGWCSRCNVGYVAGVKIESAKLFNTIDAHGHYVDLSLFTAEHCQQAIAANGFCTTCKIGFINGQAYFTRLTHGLAQGVVTQRQSLSCESCATHIGSTGWCNRCNRGIVGNVILRDRTLFSSTAAEFVNFQIALAKLPECEACAQAMVMHSTCPFCLIEYKM